MPQPALADPSAVEVYRHQLAGEAAWYETPLGDPDSSGDDGYEAKVAILLEDPVPVVSFTFGCPTRDTLDSFARAGTHTVVTVTSAEEAQSAQWAGADTVCVQGVEAGGHQSTHRDDPQVDQTGTGLLSLITQVRETVQIPIVAAAWTDARRADRRRPRGRPRTPPSSAPPSWSAPSPGRTRCTSRH